MITMPKSRKAQGKKEPRIVAGKYREITPEEEKEIIARWDMEEAEKLKLSRQLYQKITRRMKEIIPVKDENGEVFAYVRRLTDGEFNEILSKYITAISNQKPFEEMTKEERIEAEAFTNDLIATSIFLPEELKDVKEVMKLDKTLKIRLQTVVSSINGIGVSQKNLDNLLGQS